MVGRIITCVCIMFTAAAFWAIAKYGKDGKDPISFWSGDNSLKGKVTDVPAYNREMAALYNKYGWAYAVAAAGALAWIPLGIGLLVLDITVGIFLVHRAYKKILSKYS